MQECFVLFWTNNPRRNTQPQNHFNYFLQTIHMRRRWPSRHCVWNKDELKNDIRPTSEELNKLVLNGDWMQFTGLRTYDDRDGNRKSGNSILSAQLHDEKEGHGKTIRWSVFNNKFLMHLSALSVWVRIWLIHSLPKICPMYVIKLHRIVRIVF